MFRRVVVAALAVICLILPAAHEVHAQSAQSLAVDVTVGGGRGRGGEFYDRGIAGARIALGIRGRRDTRVVPFAEIAMDWVSVSGVHDAVCYVSPRGGCLQPYPQLDGQEIAVGFIAGLQSRIELRGGVGGGAYRVDGVRVGGLLTQIDAAIFPMSRLGVVAGVRAVMVPRYSGDRLWAAPWVLGFRLR